MASVSFSLSKIGVMSVSGVVSVSVTEEGVASVPYLNEEGVASVFVITSD